MWTEAGERAEEGESRVASDRTWEAEPASRYEKTCCLPGSPTRTLSRGVTVVTAQGGNGIGLQPKHQHKPRTDPAYFSR